MVVPPTRRGLPITRSFVHPHWHIVLAVCRELLLRISSPLVCSFLKGGNRHPANTRSFTGGGRTEEHGEVFRKKVLKNGERFLAKFPRQPPLCSSPRERLRSWLPLWNVRMANRAVSLPITNVVAPERIVIPQV
jgi:hypothetical protein